MVSWCVPPPCLGMNHFGLKTKQMIFSESLAAPEGLKVGQKCTKNHAKNEEAILLLYIFFAELLEVTFFMILPNIQRVKNKSRNYNEFRS